jgi:hypothetical protein
MKRSLALSAFWLFAFLGPLLLPASCARQQEPAQAVEPAKESAPAAKEPAGAAQATPDKREEAAPGAAAPVPPPPAAGQESRGRGDLLEPDEKAKAAEKPTDIVSAMSQLEATFSDLQKALALSAPDCVTAKQMRDRVCDLAEHICRLADETAAASSQRLCGDGRGRCSDAKRRYEQTCAVP